MRKIEIVRIHTLGGSTDPAPRVAMITRSFAGRSRYVAVAANAWDAIRFTARLWIKSERGLKEEAASIRKEN